MKLLLVYFLLIVSQLAFSQTDETLVPYKKGNYWGFSDIHGQIKITPQFDTVDFFTSAHIAEVRKHSLIGYINKSGKILVPTQYHSSKNASNSLYIVEKDKKVGIIDTLGTYKLALQFDSISQLNNRFFVVGLQGHFGIYELKNNTFERVIKILYDTIKLESYPDQFVCKLKDVVYTFNLSGARINNSKATGEPRVIKEFGMDQLVSELSKGAEYPMFISYEVNGKKGLIVKTKSQYIRDKGKILSDTIHPIYDSINPKQWFSNCYVVKYKDKWGAIDLKGSTIIEFEYSAIDVNSMEFQSYVAKKYRQVFVVKKGDYWGLIGNVNAFQQWGNPFEVMVPFNYDGIELSNQNFYVVKAQNKFGVLWTSDLKLITPIKYVHIKSTYNRVDDFILIHVLDDKGRTLYVGENGVEFFED